MIVIDKVAENYNKEKCYQNFMNNIQDMLPNGYSCRMDYMYEASWDAYSEPLYRYSYYVKIFRKGKLFKKLVGMISTQNLEIMGAGTSCPTLLQIFKEKFVNHKIAVTYSKNKWDWVE